ncbi:GNAT family N-acetyltransferase [Brevundimonas sp.]|uniref:GNAT family N-acetyltransferase n=1 Tax=Brevundimonas sp. TaxID=1871086 RepID=UPI003566E8FD
MSEVVFRAATPDDVAALHPLIERAYRGDTAKAGWTHEADLLFDDRTSADELTALIADPDRVVLLAHRDDVLIGCVQVARVGEDRAYLGMLTVEPTLQASGLGRRLLAAAEVEAVARFGARRMEMTVIRPRTELIAWYERRGYAPTGETRPFPVDPPRPELAFVVLEKAL